MTNRRLFVVAFVVVTLLVTACSGSKNGEGGSPTTPLTPAVLTNVTVVFRLDNPPTNATAVSIDFGYPANNGFGSVPGGDGSVGCSGIPINTGPLFSCRGSFKADTVRNGVAGEYARYGAKVMIHHPPLPSDRVCEPMFLLDMSPLPCTGKDPLGDYVEFRVYWDGTVRAGG